MKKLIKKFNFKAANFGQRFREVRQSLGLTVKEAARDIGIATSTVYRIESVLDHKVRPEIQNALNAWLGTIDIPQDVPVEEEISDHFRVKAKPNVKPKKAVPVTQAQLIEQLKQLSGAKKVHLVF